MLQKETYGELIAIVGIDHVLVDDDRIDEYCKDWTSAEKFIPAAVVVPASSEEISRVLKFCNTARIPVAVRGGGTGVSGGALVTSPSVLVSVERLNTIIEINTVDRIAIVEAGVTTGDLQRAVSEKGLLFCQNISSADSCFIGGNVAVSSGSPRSLKYGPTKNYVLNLEVVMPNGDILWTGRNVSKNSTGYNLTQLFVGSEGTLGIVTKVVLQLVTPCIQLLLMVPFDNMANLFACVRQFFNDGYSASSLEFIDQRTYEIVAKLLGPLPFTGEVAGVLWLEFEGKDKEHLLDEVGPICEMINTYTTKDISVAHSVGDIKRLWSYRSAVGEAVISISSFKDVDIVVPRSQSWTMYCYLQEIAVKYQLSLLTFGHIGNGNFHVNILTNSPTASDAHFRVLKGIHEIFIKAAELGGTLSGEHGVGRFQQPFVDTALSGPQMNLMKLIKRSFDPNNILSPQNII